MTGSILVVDDDTKVLEILGESLTRRGHTVHTAKSGEEALTVFKDKSPDMLVLDVMLPDMDGGDVMRILHQIAGEKHCPVLFLSACTDPEVMDRIFAGGAEDFMVKPFSLREFNLKVKKVLGAYRNSKEWEQTRQHLESEVEEHQGNYLQVNRDLKRQLLSMKTLLNVSTDLNRHHDVAEMINGFSLTLLGELQVSSMAFFTLPRGSTSLKLSGVKGFDRERIANLAIDLESPFARWLENSGHPQKIARRRDKQIVKKLPDLRLAIFEYVAPIIVKDRLKGMVLTGPKLNGGEYSVFDLDMLQSICNSAGIGLDNARLFDELQSTYLSTVKALVSIIEAKDAYTKGHTERVADYSVALGSKIKLSKEELRDLAFGAVLHDIGKLLVYEKILNKPGNLNEKEWKHLKQHPEIGANIIENMDFLAGTVPLVRHHHERWDGRGYPDGLKGIEIPLGARIIAVADSFDAMTTDRSYRKALSWQTALDTLSSKSAIQYDPAVVSSFVELIEVDGYQPRSTHRFTTLGAPDDVVEAPVVEPAEEPS